MKIDVSFKWTSFFLTMALACVNGCSSNDNVGYVSGVITLDGSPVENATIKFAPEKGGSPSNARTNSDGTYRLRYTRSLPGAEIGPHSVKITTYQAANLDSDPPVPGVPEKIPVQYNLSTELKAEVKAGSNRLDFPLLSAGSRPNSLKTR